MRNLTEFILFLFVATIFIGGFWALGAAIGHLAPQGWLLLVGIVGIACIYIYSKLTRENY